MELKFVTLDIFKTEKQTNARINLLFSVHTFTFEKFLLTNKEFPHLLIWGGENRVTPYKTHGICHRDLLMPEKFEMINNGGHLCMYEYPELVNELIDEYINKD